MASATTSENAIVTPCSSRIQNAQEILRYMDEKNFEINTHWILFLRLVGFTHDQILPESSLSMILGNHCEQSLEIFLDKWINDDEPETFSWETVNKHMEYLNSNDHATVILELFEDVLKEGLAVCRKCNVLLATLKAEGFTTNIAESESRTTDEQENSTICIFDLIRHSVEKRPTFLLKFIEILKVLNILIELAHKLYRECTSSCSLRSLMSISLLDSSDHKESTDNKPADIPLSPTLKKDFSNVIMQYQNLLRRIVRLILKVAREFSEDCLKNLKMVVTGDTIYDHEPVTYKDLELIVSNCVTKKNSVLDVAHALKIVQEFQIQEGIDEIKTYEDFRDAVCTTIGTDKMINKRLGKMTIADCEKITFTVRWDADKTMLADIESLLNLAFEELGCEITVHKIKPDNSIVIICYAPESLMGLLVLKCQQKLLLLKEKGVMSLKIGYCTLLDHKKDFEMNEPHLKKQMELEISALKEENESLRGRIKELNILLHDNGITTEDESETEIFYDASDKLMDEELLKPSYGTSLEPFDDSYDRGGEFATIAGNPAKMLKLLEEKEEENKALKLRNKNVFRQIDNMYGEVHDLKCQKQSLESELSKLRREAAIPKESDDTSLRGWPKPLALILVITNGVGLVLMVISVVFIISASRIPLLFPHHTKIYYPPVDIITNKFGERKTSKEHWYSPSFYSHPGGYKMCLKLRTCGQDEGYGTHLSLYVHIMSGEFDDRLAWPFKGEVRLQLLNQRSDHDHFNATVKFDESIEMKVRGPVINGLKITSGTACIRGTGNAKLISHEDLVFNQIKGTEYLKDDAMFVRVNEVIVDKLLPSEIVPYKQPEEQHIMEHKIDNFSQLRASGKSKESKPFYTHPNGYKFLLAVHANGKDNFKGQSVSVYTHIMKGEYDEQLTFPFRGRITVQLVNQRDKSKRHVEDVIKYNDQNDPYGSNGARIHTLTPANLIAGRSYNGWGCPDFVEHKFLPYNNIENTQYLSDNDELIFRIAKVEVFSK